VPYATLRLHKATNQVTYTAPFSKPIVFDLPPHFRSKPIYAAAQVLAGLCFAAPSSAAASQHHVSVRVHACLAELGPVEMKTQGWAISNPTRSCADALVGAVAFCEHSG
jgi:hypothetical protein